MNCNLESGRVLAAVDDTYDELLFLSRLAGGSGGDVTEIASDELDAHLDAYRDGDTHALHETTSALCRWLKRNPESFERVTRKRDGDDDGDEDDADPNEFAELVRSFDDVRRRLTARLTRTAEHAARQPSAKRGHAVGVGSVAAKFAAATEALGGALERLLDATGSRGRRAQAREGAREPRARPEGAAAHELYDTRPRSTMTLTCC